MDRFVSTFTNKIDAKGRVSVPASFRAVLERDGYVQGSAQGGGGGIYCYPSLDAPALDAGGQSLARKIDGLLDGLPDYSDERDELSVALYGDVHILSIDQEDLSFYDRRIPRQAHELAFDRDGVCYFTQNNWGREEQFIGRLTDGIRVFDPGRRLPLGDEVEREITQRILEYDDALHRLYLVRVGERDEDPSVLQVIDPAADSVLARIELGLTASDLLVGAEKLYVANFNSRTVSVVDKDGQLRMWPL